MVIEHEHNLLTLRGYFDRFYEIKGSDLTDKKAWEILEEEYQVFRLDLEEEYRETVADQRYSSYESFKANKWKYLNKVLGQPKR